MVYSNWPIFWVPTGVIRFCAASALATSCAGQPARLQRGRIEVDLDLALLAAERIGNGRARHRDERRAQLVDAEIGQVLLGQALARQRDLEDRHGRGAVVEDQRRRRAGRHLLQISVCEIAVTWALAVRMSTFGWKKILTMPKPL